MKQRFRLALAPAALAALGLVLAASCTTADPPTDLETAPGVAQSASGGVPVPKLYADWQHEAPVRGDPGDLLLLAGTDFTGWAKVAYVLVPNTMLPPAPPASLPTVNTASQGAITPLSVDASGVTVTLPMIMTPGQAYELFVFNPATPTGGAWSNGVMINDARPMWVSTSAATATGAASPLPGHATPPSVASDTSYPFYSTATRPGLTRELKIVGRNLQPATGAVTRVRFMSSQNIYVVNAAASSPAEISRYVARVTMPATVIPGDYYISVSRDGVAWVPVGTTHPVHLLVAADPAALPSFSINNYGDGAGSANPCLPNDSIDDTYCFSRAINDAAHYGGGNVLVPDGTWNLGGHGSANPVSCYTNNGRDTFVYSWPGQPGPIPVTYQAFPCTNLGPSCVENSGGQPFDGIRIKPGVNLVSASGAAVVVADQDFDLPFLSPGGWAPLTTTPPNSFPTDAGVRANLFRPEGNNVIQGILFRDIYPVTVDNGLNQNVSAVTPGSSAFDLRGDDITFVHDAFDGTYAAIQDEGIAGQNLLTDPTLASAPIPGNRDIIIAGSRFGAFDVPVALPVLEDSIVANNVILQGGRLTPGNGPIGFSCTSGRRIDISGNQLFGVGPGILPSPLTWPTVAGSATSYTTVGMRAGMFFHFYVSGEEMLVSGNVMKNVGNVANAFDGEAISLDSNFSGNSHAPSGAGFTSGQWVTAVSTGGGSDLVTIAPAAGETQASTPLADFQGRWLRVDYGPGLGQTRKITQATAVGAAIQFTVSPPFDVKPLAGVATGGAPVPGTPTQSRVIVSHQYWQTYLVGNTVDNTTSTTFPTSWASGLIGFYGATADSVIEGNIQAQTSGVAVAASADTVSSPPYHLPSQTSAYFVDIRANHIDRSLGWSANSGPNPLNHHGSGIMASTQVSYGNPGSTVATPDVMGFGVAIGRNVLTSAALLISQGVTVGPVMVGSAGANGAESPTTPGYLDTVVFGNAISSIPASTIPPGDPTGPSSTYVLAAITNGQSIQLDPMTGYPTAAGSYNNYPQGTMVCGNSVTAGIKVVADLVAFGEPSSLVQCSAGCLSPATPVEFFAPGMVGCGASNTSDVSICAPGYTRCTAAEWNTYRGAALPQNDYWTADTLKWTGSGSFSCDAVSTGTGNTCAPSGSGPSPMHVCTTNTTMGVQGRDTFGNNCTWVGCGLDTTVNQYFGGCATTAGSLCCAN